MYFLRLIQTNVCQMKFRSTRRSLTKIPPRPPNTSLWISIIQTKLRGFYPKLYLHFLSKSNITAIQTPFVTFLVKKMVYHLGLRANGVWSRFSDVLMQFWLFQGICLHLWMRPFSTIISPVRDPKWKYILLTIHDFWS